MQPIERKNLQNLLLYFIIHPTMIAIEIQKPQLKTETQGGNVSVPPRKRTGIGAEYGGNGGEIPPAFRKAFGNEEWKEIPTDQELDGVLSDAFGQEIERELKDQDSDPWLIRCVDEITIFSEQPNKAVSDKRLDDFMQRAKQEGLIKHGKGLRQRLIEAMNLFRNR